MSESEDDDQTFNDSESDTDIDEEHTIRIPGSSALYKNEPVVIVRPCKVVAWVYLPIENRILRVPYSQLQKLTSRIMLQDHKEARQNCRHISSSNMNAPVKLWNEEITFLMKKCPKMSWVKVGSSGEVKRIPNRNIFPMNIEWFHTRFPRSRNCSVPFDPSATNLRNVDAPLNKPLMKMNRADYLAKTLRNGVPLRASIQPKPSGVSRQAAADFRTQLTSSMRQKAAKSCQYTFDMYTYEDIDDEDLARGDIVFVVDKSLVSSIKNVLVCYKKSDLIMWWVKKFDEPFGVYKAFPSQQHSGIRMAKSQLRDMIKWLQKGPKYMSIVVRQENNNYMFDKDASQVMHDKMYAERKLGNAIRTKKKHEIFSTAKRYAKSEINAFRPKKQFPTGDVEFFTWFHTDYQMEIQNMFEPTAKVKYELLQNFIVLSIMIKINLPSFTDSY
jgi:hypothetical protein